ncbi:MAG TPA: rhodanese-like domain-containing protein [candidate division Zixibacteria bacterium]|nr:rhodanese-like domain-containing protein [candidate division Zixibacteria bacterium]
MAKEISCAQLEELMDGGSPCAVLDVRERGEFNDCQIAGATSLPRGEIEFRVLALVPDLKVPVVVYDEGGARAALAAATLAELGYEEVAVLGGGIDAWRSEGRPVATGVNVPSKRFGERLYRARHVPHVTPEELKRWQDEGRSVAVLDVRTPEEYARFCVPGGSNVPGGDLVLWAHALKQRREAMIVVNCAGRTRGIVGTATLRALGVESARVLQNGTMGWVLAGLELERSPRRNVPVPPVESVSEGSRLARRMAADAGLSRLGCEDIDALLSRRTDGPFYLVDVRSRREYESGHIAGSIHAPGGQAVQCADDFIAVRHARIVFLSNEAARATVAAYWYGEMGFRDVSVLDGGLRSWAESGRPLFAGAESGESPLVTRAVDAAAWIDARELLSTGASRGVTILDVGTSAEFGAAHLPGALWIARGRIETEIPRLFPDRGKPIVVTSPDGRAAALAARALEGMGYERVRALERGLRGWVAAGGSTEAGLARCLVEPNDVVLSPSITGDLESMKRYLEWEVTL